MMVSEQPAKCSSL